MYPQRASLLREIDPVSVQRQTRWDEVLKATHCPNMLRNSACEPRSRQTRDPN